MGKISGGFNRIREGPRQNPFSIIFSFIVGALKWIILIVLIVLIVLIPITIYRSGGLASAYQNAVVTFDKTPVVGPSLRFLGSIVPAIWNPQTSVELTDPSYQWKTNVDENVGNRDLGLTFDEFQTEWRGYFRVKASENQYTQSIIAIGSGKINSMMEDSEVTFECDADDGEIIGEVLNPYGPIQLDEGMTKYFRARCEFQGEDFDIGDKILTPYTIRLKAHYNFNTLGYLTIYTMRGTVLEQKLKASNYNREIIFKDIDNQYLDKKTGEVSSTQTYGPVKLNIRGLFYQPLSEESEDGDVYSLEIDIRRDAYWDGTLKEIQNLYIYTDQDIEIEDTGKFDYVGEDGALKKYKLVSEEIDKLNEVCLNDDNVFESDCWTTSPLPVYLDFRVNIDNDELNQRYIKAELQYIYESEISDVIEFKRDEE